MKTQKKIRNIISNDGSDWSNSGGNAGRNGLSSEVGPITSTLIWSGGRPSIISWHPVTEGNRLFMVRQTGWPGSQNDSIVVCMNLSTGEEIWAREIPYHEGDWIAWIAGVKNGRVFASRSGNGASVNDTLYALDAENGNILWLSGDLIDAGAYDGVVFTSDGDPIVASFSDIWRINAEDGTTVWHNTRLAPASGNCGGALFEDAFYVIDMVSYGQILIRYNVNTGQKMYQSPKMDGMWIQTTPMVGPDGTIYVNRVQNNPSVDFLYSWTDTGSGFIQKWNVSSAYNPASELGIGPDGSVYDVIPGPKVARLNPENGSLINSYSIPSSQFLISRFAIDSQGKVFFSTGDDDSGHLYTFTANLTLLWDVAVPHINIGGPALGKGGILVVCGIGNDIFAYGTNFHGPSIPLINGPTNGKKGIQYNYTFSSVDPLADDVYYYIEWGDGANTGWFGPYPSGDTITQSHTWTKKGIYTIKAKAKDSYGTQSDWGTLSVTMPYSFNIPFMQLWMKLFQRFPNAFPILRNLMEY